MDVDVATVAPVPAVDAVGVLALGADGSAPKEDVDVAAGAGVVAVDAVGVGAFGRDRTVLDIDVNAAAGVVAPDAVSVIARGADGSALQKVNVDAAGAGVVAEDAVGAGARGLDSGVLGRGIGIAARDLDFEQAGAVMVAVDAGGAVNRGADAGAALPKVDGDGVIARPSAIDLPSSGVGRVGANGILGPCPAAEAGCEDGQRENRRRQDREPGGMRAAHGVSRSRLRKAPERPARPAGAEYRLGS